MEFEGQSVLHVHEYLRQKAIRIMAPQHWIVIRNGAKKLNKLMLVR